MAQGSESLSALVAGKRVVPPVPQGRAVNLSGEDQPASSLDRDETTSLALFIQYCDAKGVVSSRRIVCRSYDVATDTITAFCFERGALREFKIERVIEAVCTQSGEVYDLTVLTQALKRNGLPVRDGRLNLVLRFLTFLMRCDGVHPAEEEMLEHAITSYALRFDGDDALVEQALRQARTMAPDDRDFLNALYSIGKRSDRANLAKFIRLQARRVIEADGRISAEEARLGAELDAVLGKLAE
jgi:hypothetical protein